MANNFGVWASGCIIFLMINLVCLNASSELGLTNIGDIVVNKVFASSVTGTERVQINGTEGFNEGLDSGLDKKQNPVAALANYIASFVDALQKVFSFLITILTIGFGVFNLLAQTGAPIILTQILGLPTAFGFYLSVVMMIRGAKV